MLTPKLDRSSEGEFEVMNTTMDTQRVKLDFGLAKHLPIAYHYLDLDLLAQVDKFIARVLINLK